MKVQTANYENVIADLKALLRTARTMKKLRLDNGMDLPTIFEAYFDVIDEEFNFKIEHEKIDYFGKLFEQTPEICDKCVRASRRRVDEKSFSHATRSRRKIVDYFQSSAAKRETSAVSATSF